jgi:hypothetical protein
VTAIGLTGHQKMPAVARDHAERELRTLIARHPGITGLTCLAAGADQLFARILLEAGNTLHAVIPSCGYERTFNAEDLATYRDLYAAAAEVTVLDFAGPGEHAYHAAGIYIVEHCDLLAAVWDGRPAQGLGGTGDVVAYARAVGRPVVTFWPQGVSRT